VAKTSFRRGFKAEAERLALELRRELGLDFRERLDPNVLAEHLCVPIRTLLDLASDAREDVAHFLGRGKAAFSAVTIHVGRFRRLIVTNPAHSLTRQGNTICHEISHIVLEHEAELPVNVQGGREWNGTQEREADWLAACLLIPNDAAHAAARAGQTDDEVALTFGVSRALAAWRMRSTGARIRALRLSKLR
jgi:uncharacterized protein DUF955